MPKEPLGITFVVPAGHFADVIDAAALSVIQSGYDTVEED